MQCYEFLAIRQYARPIIGNDSDRYDDLELADRLDELDIDSFRDVERLMRAGDESESTRH